MKNIRELMKDEQAASLIEWDLHPFDAVARYLEWGCNWSRGLDHAKACNEESVYFKINAMESPIHEKEKPKKLGIVLDITEGGLRLKGIEAITGESKKLCYPGQKVF